MKNKKAFTLIELLVVVLIIGILSAVALPQYQRAVEKSKIANQLALLPSIWSAAEACKLEMGDIASCTLDTLSITPPSCKPIAGFSSCSINIRATKSNHTLVEVRNQYDLGNVTFLKDKNQIYCGYAGAYPSKMKEYCSSFGFNQTCEGDDISSGALFFIDGKNNIAVVCQ